MTRLQEPGCLGGLLGVSFSFFSCRGKWEGEGEQERRGNNLNLN